MSKLSKILNQIQDCSVDDLKFLISYAEFLICEAESFDFDFNGKNYRLTPVHDKHLDKFYKDIIAIEECWMPWHFYLKPPIGFPDIYIVLREICGENSKALDDYKQVFSFRFNMCITHNKSKFAYRFNIYSYKGSVEIRFYKVVSEDDPRSRTNCFYPPCEEFTKDDQQNFFAYFLGFLKGYRGTMDPKSIEPFVFHIKSSAIVFGFFGGKGFDERHDSQESAEKANANYLWQISRELHESKT